ncbi:MAG: lysylphosphatidylglycerol synthase transmembrane domain-containing protein, partial [Bacteroidales bacterium]
MSKSKSALYRNLFFVVGIITILLMVNSIGFDTIYQNIQQAGLWFGVIIAIWAIVYIINAISLQLIISDGSAEGERVNFLHTLKIIISGYAINYTTPMGLLGGEPYRVMELKPVLGVKKATSAVILYAMMHFVSHFILWLLAVLLIVLFVPIKSDFLTYMLWGIFSIASLLIFAFFRWYKSGMVFRLITILSKIPGLKKRVAKYRDNNEESLREIDFLISDLWINRRRTFFASLSVELLSRLFSCLEVYVLLYAIGVDITYMQSVIIVALATLIANLVFFSPMQLGSREGGYALALSTLSLSYISGAGIYVSLSTRIRELFWIFVGISVMKYKSLKGNHENVG